MLARYVEQPLNILSSQVVWGPLSLLTALLITLSHPLRHTLQIIVSVGHIYGATLYYATSITAAYLYDMHFSRPEAYYFWGYYVGSNFPWIVVPGLLIWSSAKEISHAFRVLRTVEGSLGRYRDQMVESKTKGDGSAALAGKETNMSAT